MAAYILRRLMLMPGVLFLTLLFNFLIINLAVPAGPIDQIIAQMTGESTSATERIRGLSSGEVTKGSKAAQKSSGIGREYEWAKGLAPETIKKIKKQFGLDKPLLTRFKEMIFHYIKFNFGESFFVNRSVISLIIERMPVSISLGLWSTLLIYIISLPLGIYKAKRHGSHFDTGTDAVLVAAYAIPPFLFAVLLIMFFCGGKYWNIFPLSGLVSENWHELSFWGKIGDYFWHLTLPTTCFAIGGFTILTMMTKNFFLEEINKQYVMTARAKGATEKRILFGHVFRNAMLVIVGGFPATLIGILFTGTVLFEVIFSLHGLGLLGYEAVIKRDYPIIFGTLYISVLLGLIIRLVSDLTYKVIDPRIDFESREV